MIQSGNENRRAAIGVGIAISQTFCNKMSDAYLTIQAATLEDGLPKLLHDLKSRVIPDHERAGITFDEIRFEIWWDSGRVIAFPALRPLDKRIDTSGAQIVCSDFLAQAETLMDSELSDDDFDDEIIRMLEPVIKFITDSCSDLEPKTFGIYDPDSEELYSAEQGGGGQAATRSEST